MFKDFFKWIFSTEIEMKGILMEFAARVRYLLNSDRKEDVWIGRAVVVGCIYMIAGLLCLIIF